MPDYKISKICPICNKVFSSYKCKNQKTCSQICKHQFHSLNMKNGEERKCKTCNKLYYLSLSKTEQKFCSMDCYLNRPGKYSICPICKKRMYSSRKTCSVACMSIAYKTQLKGENNPNWKGGNFSRENSLISSNLRKEILQRDNFRCQSCGAKDWEKKPSLLHIHHIIEFENKGTQDPSNLITLCFVCHWVDKHGYKLNSVMQEIASQQNCGNKS